MTNKTIQHRIRIFWTIVCIKKQLECIIAYSNFLQQVFSLNFRSAGKGPFIDGKPKKYILLFGGGRGGGRGAAVEWGTWTRPHWEIVRQYSMLNLLSTLQRNLDINKGEKDCQNLFTIMRFFHSILRLFFIYFIITEVKKILHYTNKFII